MIGLLPHFPGLVGYASSKHASECFVNTLRLEMRPFGVRVINVCPGTTQTPFLHGAQRQMQSMWQLAPDAVRTDYGDRFAQCAAHVACKS